MAVIQSFRTPHIRPRETHSHTFTTWTPEPNFLDSEISKHVFEKGMIGFRITLKESRMRHDNFMFVANLVYLVFGEINPYLEGWF
jgi:hypothetical protein